MGTCLSGQETGMLVGTVLDRQNGKPMIAANISADRTEGTTTNEQGKFLFNLSPGKHIIEFFYVGYEMEKREITVVSGEVLRIGIRMSVISKLLEEVVVSAGKYEAKNLRCDCVARSKLKTPPTTQNRTLLHLT